MDLSCDLATDVGGTPAQVLQVSAFEAVALPTEQLQVVHRGGTAQSHRDDVVVLKVELASALGALATISFEHGPADLAGDGLALSLGPRLPAFIDVEHHVRPVQALSLPALPVPDQGQFIPFAIAAGLPVEGIFEPPPDAGAGSGDGHWVLPLDGREVTVVSAIDARWRTACRNEPDTSAEQETPVTKKTGVRILTQLRVSGCGRPPGKRGDRRWFSDYQRQNGKQGEADSTDGDHVA